MDKPTDGVPSRLERLVREEMSPPRDGLELPVFSLRADRLLGVLEAEGWVSEFDGEGRMLYTSPNIETALGFTAEECIGSDRIEFHPEDLHKVITGSRSVRQTGNSAKIQTQKSCSRTRPRN